MVGCSRFLAEREITGSAKVGDGNLITAELHDWSQQKILSYTVRAARAELGLPRRQIRQTGSVLPGSISTMCPGSYPLMTTAMWGMIMPVQEVVESGISVDEHVLLGCFGLDLAAVRQKKQLRLALRRADYPAHSPRT